MGEIGFLVIEGHGIDPAEGSQLYNSAMSFFDLSLDEKLAVRRPRNDQNRGYIPYGEETLARMHGGNTPPDYKEVFAIGPDNVPSTEYYTGPLAYPDFASNLWPMEPVTLRSNMLTYYASMVDLSRLRREFMQSLSICRKISLPPNLNAILHNYGCFTILCPTNHFSRVNCGVVLIPIWG